MAEIDNANIRPLPKLKIVSNEFFTQEIADKVMDYVQGHNADDIEMVSYNLEEGLGWYHHIGNAVTGIRSAQKEFNLSTDPLFEINMGYELARRILVAYDQPDLPIKGIPLAPSRNGPFPPLVLTPLHKYSAALPVSKVHKIIADYYRDNPEWCYYQGESMRRRLPIYLIYPDHYNYVKEKVAAEFSASDREIENKVSGAISTTISQMCKI